MNRAKVYIGVDKSKSYRVHLTITTGIVNEARLIHKTSPLATAALGRVLSITGIMSLELKGEKNSISLVFKGDGPARQILATGYGDGRIKGYISNPDVELPLNDKGKLDVGGALGRGELYVTKDLGLKDTYVGMTELVSGEIAEDVTSYFLHSEQKFTSVALGVKIGKDKRVLAAGGILIEVLPDAKDEAIDELENLVLSMKPITTYIEETILESGSVSEEEKLNLLIEKIFLDIDEEYKPELLDYRDIVLHCDCSRERIEKALMTIGKQEMENIIREDKKAELSCHFCNKKYFFDKEDLEKIEKLMER